MEEDRGQRRWGWQRGTPCRGVREGSRGCAVWPNEVERRRSAPGRKTGRSQHLVNYSAEFVNRGHSKWPQQTRSVSAAASARPPRRASTSSSLSLPSPQLQRLMPWPPPTLSPCSSVCRSSNSSSRSGSAAAWVSGGLWLSLVSGVCWERMREGEEEMESSWSRVLWWCRGAGSMARWVLCFTRN